MKKIIFIRSAPYRDRVENKSLIKGFDLIGRKLVDPQISKPSKKTIRRINLLEKIFKPVKIYSSNSLRSQNTAKIFSKDFEVCNLINEIEFFLEESKNKDVNILRLDLIKDFVGGKFREKNHDVELRINEFISQTNLVNENILCVSNAFIMKFYEIYFRNKGNLKNSKLFLTGYDWKVKPYEFLDGFSLTLQNDGKIKQVELLRDLIK